MIKKWQMPKMAIILIILISSITSCQSNKTIEYKTVVSYPELIFPIYPAPKLNVVPLDIDGKVIRDNDTEIAMVMMPYWYYELIVDYKSEVDKQKKEYESFVAHASDVLK